MPRAAPAPALLRWERRGWVTAASEAVAQGEQEQFYRKGSAIGPASQESRKKVAENEETSQAFCFPFTRFGSLESWLWALWVAVAEGATRRKGLTSWGRSPGLGQGVAPEGSTRHWQGLLTLGTA